MSREDVRAEQDDQPWRRPHDQRIGARIAQVDQALNDQVQSGQVQSDQTQSSEVGSAGTLSAGADCQDAVFQQDQNQHDQCHHDQCHHDQCEEALSHLDEFVDGEVDPQRHLNIAAHLDDCSPCQRQYALEAVIKSLVARSCAEHAPPALRARVVAQLVIARWRITS